MKLESWVFSLVLFISIWYTLNLTSMLEMKAFAAKQRNKHQHDTDLIPDVDIQ